MTILSATEVAEALSPRPDADVWKGIADGKQLVIAQLERAVAERDAEIERLRLALAPKRVRRFVRPFRTRKPRSLLARIVSWLGWVFEGTEKDDGGWL
jgi:hypothetical protein